MLSGSENTKGASVSGSCDCSVVMCILAVDVLFGRMLLWGGLTRCGTQLNYNVATSKV